MNRDDRQLTSAARPKKKEARSNEARSKKQEARSKKQEARSSMLYLIERLQVI
jgi:hypothetical protein